ncbi:hypothetical protein [Romboutsia hominis]|uniref:hypothetical protein n=1 Tax=Romboutsia hominis TaxID=1507512 RepID=UPI001F0672EC|nr:hypothetical protein [Romboutsia hominis]MCH1959053.1 hypothetical protein [Romboutsia hominis]
MNSKENNSSKNLEDSIEKLSKNLYLESPDLWIEFSGKVNDNIFDEMVLFFAIKYNYKSIVEHAISNNLIDLNAPSRNNDYPNIKEHLIFIAKQNKALDILNYLENPSSCNDINEDTVEKKIDNSISNLNANKKNKYFPKYLCSYCKHNVFESGYRVSESVEYKYSLEEDKPTEISRELSSLVVCCNCNKELKDTSIEDLNKLCSIQNCANCGSNLTVVGIIDKSKMSFDNDLGKFSNVSKSYHCSKCDTEISEKQREFFNI